MSIGGVNADRIPKTNGLVMSDSVSQSHLKATYYDKHFLRRGGCHRYLHRQSSESGRGKFGVNATRIYRTGVELLARPDQRLQVGDRIRVVGPSDAVERLAARLGNSHNQLDHPNILTILVGIFIGILFGSLPIAMFLRIITAQVLILILG